MPRILSTTLSTTSLPREVAVLTHCGSQFFHARRRFFERCGLVFSACGKIGVAGRDFIGAEVNGVGRLANGLHGARDARLHLGKS